MSVVTPLQTNFETLPCTKTRADTAHTLVYLDYFRLSQQSQTVTTVADCQDNFRQLQTVAYCQGSCRLSRQLQRVTD